LTIGRLDCSNGRKYVSQLAREVGISRPLLHLHLQKLEAAGLVNSKLELSPDGKALNYFEVSKFAIVLTPASIAKAAASLPDPAQESD
jgi:predicted transcriptional regulator